MPLTSNSPADERTRCGSPTSTIRTRASRAKTADDPAVFRGRVIRAVGLEIEGLLFSSYALPEY
jgi:hypothetical protein